MSAHGRSTIDASALVLDGAAIAEGVLTRVAEEVRALMASGVTPGLAVVLVGDDPASQTYVAGKGRAAKACGLHPGFRWPLGEAGREGALVRFQNAERPEVPRLEPGGLIGKTTRPIPLSGRDLPLSDALFEHDALCFLDCKSRSLAFIDASGASITMEYEDFPHAALWTRPHAPFLCLEAWTGYSDPDGFAGDLFDKPGMRALEPGESARHEARYVFRAE